MLDRLKSWLKRTEKQRPDLRVLMYSRKDCHLCEVAWALLKKHQRRRGFTLDTVDVDGAPELAAKYGDRVPVVLVNGQERFRGRVNETLLLRLLDADGTNP